MQTRYHFRRRVKRFLGGKIWLEQLPKSKRVLALKKNYHGAQGLALLAHHLLHLTGTTEREDSNLQAETILSKWNNCN